MISSDDLLFVLTLIGALGCGLMAGVFFAFSAFVMNGLAQIEPDQGITAMQSINITVINPIFLGVFLGTAIDCVFLIFHSVLHWHNPDSHYLLMGSLFYLAGTLMVTALYHVPKNNALASIDPTHPESVKLWKDYVERWTRWNHVRTASSLAATASLTLALCN